MSRSCGLHVAWQVCNEGPKEKLDDTVYSQVCGPSGFCLQSVTSALFRLQQGGLVTQDATCVKPRSRL